MFKKNTSNSKQEKLTTCFFFSFKKKIVQQIKPRRVLIIAVDGVAPRAKMNQQRSRRFRSAQETSESLERARQRGEDVPNQEDMFDSNCITPGTKFMEKLNAHFEYFIRKKITEDETWRNLNVLFSGHDVPGEGEHKIMSYIRKMKSQQFSGGEEYDQTFISFRDKVNETNDTNELWNPNATHCFYGLDADLIMLSLVTHEPHFSLLRENSLKQVKPQDLTTLVEERGKNQNKKSSNTKKQQQEDFQLLHISILREYLHEEFKDSLPEESDSGFIYDFERIIDDFVFMCYFIGNDFLPNLPFLDISDEALNKMFMMYKNYLHTFGDYLTFHGSINLEPCKRFMQHVSTIEKEILGVTSFASGQDDSDKESTSSNSSKNSKKDKKDKKELQSRLETLGLSQLDIEAQRAAFEELNPDESWKQGYYLHKFKKPLEATEFHKKLRFDYLQGLAWVLKYYYSGCQSWGWFYPYHYAPLASDLIDFQDFEQLDKFPPSDPFEPFQQLLGVLPIASKKLLPVEYQKLMTQSSSPLQPYYPLEFEVDQNGKRNSWEGVVLIPFIDEHVLRKACESIDPTKLTKAEKDRNRLSEHSTWYYYDEKFSTTLQATLPGIPPLKNLHTQKKSLLLPRFETNFTLCSGVLMGPEAPSHFPTLRTLPFSSYLKYARVCLFRGPSRKETLVIKIEKESLWEVPVLPFSDVDPDEDSFITEEEIADREIAYHKQLAIEEVQCKKVTQELGKKLIGNIVYSNWPYHEEGRVMEICCKELVVRRDHVIKNEAKWEQLEKQITNDFLTKRGIEIGPLQVLVRIEPIAGMRRSAKGALNKEFSSSFAYWQPYQALLTDIKNKDDRYKERGIQPVEEMFPVDSLVVITRKEFCGSSGKVVAHKAPDLCKVIFNPITLPLPNFAKKNYHSMAEETFSLNQIATLVHTNNRVIAQITAEIWISTKKNIGLALKYSSRNEKVQGYAERVNNTWFFTQKAVDLIMDYKNTFPEVFKALENSNGNETLTPNSLFPDSANPKEKLKELMKWISSLNLSSLPKISAEDQYMSPNAAKATEEQFASLLNSVYSQSKRTTVINRKFLQRPMHGLVVNSSNSDDLVVGDFVCYLRSSSGPPFGSLAVVISVNSEKLLTLLFGSEFIGGNDFNGNCSSYRCLKNVEARYCLKLPSKSFTPKYKKEFQGRSSSNSPSYNTPPQLEHGAVKIQKRTSNSKTVSPALSKSTEVHTTTHSAKQSKDKTAQSKSSGKPKSKHVPKKSPQREHVPKTKKTGNASEQKSPVPSPGQSTKSSNPLMAPDVPAPATTNPLSVSTPAPATASVSGKVNLKDKVFEQSSTRPPANVMMAPGDVPAAIPNSMISPYSFPGNPLPPASRPALEQMLQNLPTDVKDTKKLLAPADMKSAPPVSQVPLGTESYYPNTFVPRPAAGPMQYPPQFPPMQYPNYYAPPHMQPPMQYPMQYPPNTMMAPGHLPPTQGPAQTNPAQSKPFNNPNPNPKSS